MFTLEKHTLQIGGASGGGGSSSGTNASRGTKTGTATDKTKSKQTTTQQGRNESTGKTSQQTSGTTGTQGSKTGTSATQQTSRTKGTTGTKGNVNTSAIGTTSQSQTAKGTTASSTTGTSGTTGTAKSSLQQTLASLDEGTQAQLVDLISAIGSPEDAKALQDSLTSRALNADADLGASTDAIISSARRSGERAITANATNLAKSAGSTQNSLVAQIGLEGQVDLETELAALKQTLNLQNRDTATTELQAALGGTVGGAVDIAGILKGATQTTEQTSGQTTEQAQTSAQIANQSTTSIGDTTGTSTTQQNQTNQSTQVIDQSTASDQTTKTSEQNQQLITALQSILGSSSSTDITSLINDVISQTNKQRTIDEAFQSSGNTQGQKVSGGISLGF